MAVEYKLRGDASQLKKELQSVTAKEKRLEQQTIKTKQGFEKLSTSALRNENALRRAKLATQKITAAELKFAASAKVATAGLVNQRRVTTGLAARIGALRNQILLVTFAIAGAAAVFGKFIKEASKLEESQNAVNVIFREGVGSIREFGKTAAQSVGLTQSSFNQLASVTGALVKSIGLPMKDVADLTIDLTKRAADMASVFDTDVSQALNAINSALRGQTEPLTRYAADTTINTLNQFALAEGIEKTVLQMSIQEKRLLIIRSIMDQTSDAADDFKNTQDSFANATRILTANIGELAAEIGSDFQDNAKGAVGILNSLVTSIRAIRKASTFDTTDETQFLFTFFTSEENKEKIRAAARATKELKEQVELLSKAMKPGDVGFIGPVQETQKQFLARMKEITVVQGTMVANEKRLAFFANLKKDNSRVEFKAMKTLSETQLTLALQAAGITREEHDLQMDLFRLQGDKNLLEAASNTLITTKLKFTDLQAARDAKALILAIRKKEIDKAITLEARRGVALSQSLSNAFAQAVVHSDDLLQSLKQIGLQLASNVLGAFLASSFTPVSFGKAFFGFQHGGQFQVGGSGGPDSKLVAFKASPGETVTITPPNQTTNNNTSKVTFNFSFPNVREIDEFTLRSEIIPKINELVQNNVVRLTASDLT